MQRLQCFEDLVAWQKARKLAATIYVVTNQTQFAKEFGLKDQIRRASVSIMSNIAEGFERGSSNEFHQFLVIAKASCAEVRSQMYVALDAGYIDETLFHQIHNKALELAKVIGGLRASVAKTRIK